MTRAENLILMTATPHNGDPRGFYSLVRLLDPYVSPTERKIDRNRIERFVVRRTKRQINQLYGKRKFAERKPPQLIRVRFNDAERELYSAVCEYTDRNWRRARRTPGREAVSFAMMILKKRMLSSLHALRNSLKHRHDNLSEEIIDLQAKRGLVRDYKAGPPLREDQIQRVEEELLTCPVEKDLNAIRRDRKHLEGLLQKAERLDPTKDSKAVALARKLEEVFRENSSEKLIVFTEYRDTQAFLKDFLTHPDRGYEGRIVLMHGGMDRSSRKEAEKIFSRPQTGILLATDAASEGLNFQQRCHIVVHYELPWNPNRLEQRNGRVDRWGQEKDVEVFNLYLDEDECLEADILELLVKKLERIRRDLGSVADVTGVASGLDVHEDMMLVGRKRKRSEEGKRLLSELDRKYENLLDQRKRRLTFWRESQEDASLPRKNLADIYDARDRTESLVPGPESLEEFVKDRITMAGGSLIPTSEGEFAIVVPQVFQRPGVKARYDRATFDREKALADIERRIEFLTPAHPLVDAIIRHVRSSPYDPRAMNRMAYKTVKMDIDPGVLFTFLARFHDGVGRVIQEHMEPIFVSLGGAPSLNPELDRKILKAPFGNDLPEYMLRSMFENALVTLRN
ncbi:MAG: helicase-related protein, partial [Thermoplasmata archaeon]